MARASLRKTKIISSASNSQQIQIHEPGALSICFKLDTTFDRDILMLLAERLTKINQAKISTSSNIENIKDNKQTEIILSEYLLSPTKPSRVYKKNKIRNPLTQSLGNNPEVDKKIKSLINANKSLLRELNHFHAERKIEDANIEKEFKESEKRLLVEQLVSINAQKNTALAVSEIKNKMNFKIEELKEEISRGQLAEVELRETKDNCQKLTKENCQLRDKLNKLIQKIDNTNKDSNAYENKLKKIEENKTQANNQILNSKIKDLLEKLKNSNELKNKIELENKILKDDLKSKDEQLKLTVNSLEKEKHKVQELLDRSANSSMSVDMTQLSKAHDIIQKLQTDYVKLIGVNEQLRNDLFKIREERLTQLEQSTLESNQSIREDFVELLSENSFDQQLRNALKKINFKTNKWIDMASSKTINQEIIKLILSINEKNEEIKKLSQYLDEANLMISNYELKNHDNLT